MLPDLARWLSSGKYFNYRGHQVFFKKTEGRKRQWILLIHGFPTSSWDYAPIWDMLAKKYNLLAVDLLGYGFSSKPRNYNYTIVEQAEILSQLLKQEKIKTFHILAHDYGVSVAQELLARQFGKKSPALSVCFLNGGLYPEFHKPLLVQKLMLTRLGPMLARFFTKRKLKSTFDSIFGDRKASAQEIEAFWQLVEYNDGRMIAPQMLRYLVERRQHRERWVNGTEKTVIPVQMINGPLDPISGAHLAKAFAERNPRALVHSLPGVGHYPQVEAPDKVADLYLKFLSQ